MRLDMACQIIGEDEVIAIAERMVQARHKHPDNGGSRDGSAQAVEEEAEEFSMATFGEPEERQDDEALDVIVTAIRFRRKEYAITEP